MKFRNRRARGSIGLPTKRTDAVARILAEGMRASLGQPIIIENVSGAGGSLGVRRVARAAPDGYTLSIGQVNSHVFGGAIYGAQYNVVMDFEPIAPLTTHPLMFVWKKDSAGGEYEKTTPSAQCQAPQAAFFD